MHISAKYIFIKLPITAFFPYKVPAMTPYSASLPVKILFKPFIPILPWAKRPRTAMAELFDRNGSDCPDQNSRRLSFCGSFLWKISRVLIPSAEILSLDLRIKTFLNCFYPFSIDKSDENIKRRKSSPPFFIFPCQDFVSASRIFPSSESVNFTGITVTI